MTRTCLSPSALLFSQPTDTLNTLPPADTEQQLSDDLLLPYMGVLTMVTPEEEQSYDKANEAIEGTIWEVLPGGLPESPAEKHIIQS